MPRQLGAWVLAGIGVAIAALLAAVFLMSLGGQDSDAGGESPRSYDALASNLQSDVRVLPDDADWRTESAREDSNTPAWLRGLADWLEDVGTWIRQAFSWLGDVIFSTAGWVIMASLALVFIGYLIVKYGQFGGLTLRSQPGWEVGASLPGDNAHAGAGAAQLSLAEIRAMEDLPRALGALLTLALGAAARLAGIVLSRSDTAREALRRLPRDFALLGVIETLVREAERVRFAGQSITRERFEALIASVEELINRASDPASGSAASPEDAAGAP